MNDIEVTLVRCGRAISDSSLELRCSNVTRFKPLNEYGSAWINDRVDLAEALFSETPLLVEQRFLDAWIEDAEFAGLSVAIVRR
jgi:hypothetical protein